MTTDPQDRATLTARLRAMADWLDAHPDIPISQYATVYVRYFTTADAPADFNAIQHAALDSHFTRDAGDTWDVLTYVPEPLLDGWGVAYEACIDKRGADVPPDVAAMLAPISTADVGDDPRGL